MGVRDFARSFVAAWRGARADYSDTRSNQFIRRRRGLGGTGDAHYRAESRYEHMRELVREMDRNESMVGPLTERAVGNQLQGGYKLQPTTPDPILNADIKAAYEDWANDPKQCDHYRLNTIWELDWFSKRATYVDGDCCQVLLSDNSVQMLEADRLRNPSGESQRNVVHGVEMINRRRVAYWFTEDPGDERKSLRGTSRVDASFVLHVTNPQTRKRITQTRGVTAFWPVISRLAMHEDLQFSHLVKQQIAAYVALFLSRDQTYKGGGAQFGPRGSEDDGWSNTRDTEEMIPGQIVRGAPGESASILAANIPSSEYFQQIRSIMLEISTNLGVPLILAMMDASETNFTGWRGAMEAAKTGWRINQTRYIGGVVTPRYRWWLLNARNAGQFGTTAFGLGDALFSHRVNRPVWPYQIQPLHDAQANKIKLDNGQVDPRRHSQEQGGEWDDHTDNLVDAWADLVSKAKARAMQINSEVDDGDPVSWRDLARMPTVDGVSLSGSLLDRSTQREAADG